MPIRKFLSLFRMKNSIQTKIFVAFSLVMLTALVSVSAAIYLNLTENIKKNAIRHAASSINQADASLNTILQEANHISTVAVSNTTNIIDPLLSDHSPISYMWFMESKQVREFLSSLMAYKPHILRISVVGTNGKSYHEGRPWLDPSRINQDYLARVIAGKGQKVFNKNEGTGSPESLSMGRSIQHNGKSIGAVIIDIHFQVVRKTYGVQPYEDSFTYLIDQDGYFVYNSDPAMNAQHIEDTPLSPVFLEVAHANREIERSLFGQNYLIVSRSPVVANWTVISTVPEYALIEDSIQLRNRMIQIVVFAFVIVLIVSIALASQITKNLIRLRNRMLWVKDGNLSAPLQLDSGDEIGQLSEAFNDMLDKINGLVEDIKSREKQKRVAELTALQAQIRPHFLYNTLNTITYLAHLRNASNIEEVSRSLIDLLRGVLGDTREFVSLAKELEYVQSFVRIQSYRFTEPIHLDIHADDGVLDYRILKLTLQPIVENAVLHGLESSEDEGRIDIYLQKCGPHLIIEIRDNGVGMTDEKRRELFVNRATEDNPAQGRFSGIGLHNVHERLRLVYGEACSLHIDSQPGRYTCVRIQIPAEMSDCDDQDKEPIESAAGGR